MKILSNLKVSYLHGLKKGFTLAEVLITLTIIGVIAALTIPSLLANVSDKTYESKRKGLQTRLAQAVSQMDSLNSYIDKDDPEKNSSMKFVVDGLSKVYKITNVCEFENFKACDFPEKITLWYSAGQMYTKDFRHVKSHGHQTLTDEDLGGPQADAVAFKTKNGESFLLWYNPYCIAEQEVKEGGQKKFTREVCAMFEVDLDGAKKGPNIVGRDIMYGIILYPDMPYTLIMNVSFVGPSVNKPSYSASGDNAEQICSKTANHGLSAGSLTLATREQAYILSIFHSPYPNSWTSSVTGSSGDDYGWMLNKRYIKYVKRSTAGTQYYCVKKSS